MQDIFYEAGHLALFALKTIMASLAFWFVVATVVGLVVGVCVLIVKYTHSYVDSLNPHTKNVIGFFAVIAWFLLGILMMGLPPVAEYNALGNFYHDNSLQKEKVLISYAGYVAVSIISVLVFKITKVLYLRVRR